VDIGETPGKAVVREAREELAYELKAPQHWMSQPFVHEGLSYTQHVFIEQYDGTALVLGEGQAMAWFAPCDTTGLLLSAHSRAAIDALGRWLASGAAKSDARKS